MMEAAGFFLQDRDPSSTGGACNTDRCAAAPPSTPRTRPRVRSCPGARDFVAKPPQNKRKMHAFWLPKQQCNQPQPPQPPHWSTRPTGPVDHPADPPTHRAPHPHPTLALGLRTLGAPGPPPGPCFLFLFHLAPSQPLAPRAAHSPRDQQRLPLLDLLLVHGHDARLRSRRDDLVRLVARAQLPLGRRHHRQRPSTCAAVSRAPISILFVHAMDSLRANLEKRICQGSSSDASKAHRPPYLPGRSRCGCEAYLAGSSAPSLAARGWPGPSPYTVCWSSPKESRPRHLRLSSPSSESGLFPSEEAPKDGVAAGGALSRALGKSSRATSRRDLERVRFFLAVLTFLICIMHIPWCPHRRPWVVSGGGGAL